MLCKFLTYVLYICGQKLFKTIKYKFAWVGLDDIGDALTSSGVSEEEYGSGYLQFFQSTLYGSQQLFDDTTSSFAVIQA